MRDHTDHNAPISVAWITRSFLDYRVPVFAALDRLVSGRLNVVYSRDYVPRGAREKLRAVLGDRALALDGEWRLGAEDRDYLANRNFSLRYHPNLLRTIRRLRPDVLVCDGFFKWTFPALVHRMLCGTPLVVLYERTPHTERNAQWYRRLYRRAAMRRIDAMGCSGRLCAEYAQSLGMPAERITLGHMSADTDYLGEAARSVATEHKAALRQSLRVQGTLCLCVGRLIERKGCREFLQAWGDFESRHPAAATLVFVGDGALRTELQQMVERGGLRQVRFTGDVPFDRLVTYHAAADILVSPTLEDNWSLVVPEAMASGLPVLCSIYNGCCPDLIQDRMNGWRFDPLRRDDAARALDEIVVNAGRLREMGVRSRAIIRDGHTPAHAARSILEACRIAMHHRAR